MELADITLNAFVSVLTGMFVSFCFFLFLLKFYQPKLEIADEAVRSFSKDGDEIIKVKVRNLRRRPVSGIRAELHRLRYAERENGMISQTHLIPLMRSDPLGLGPENDPQSTDIYIFRSLGKTRNDVPVINAMNEYENCFLLFRVLVVDGHSGLGKLYRRTYKWPGDVRNGEYIAGRNLVVGGRKTAEPSDPVQGG